MNQEQRYPISQYWNIDFLFYFFSKYCGKKIHLILISDLRMTKKSNEKQYAPKNVFIPPQDKKTWSNYFKLAKISGKQGPLKSK